MRILEVAARVQGGGDKSGNRAATVRLRTEGPLQPECSDLSNQMKVDVEGQQDSKGILTLPAWVQEEKRGCQRGWAAWRGQLSRWGILHRRAQGMPGENVQPAFRKSEMGVA